MLYKQYLQIVILLCLTVVSNSIWSSTPADTAEDRLGYVSKLLYSTSGAKQVMNSLNEEATIKRHEAITMYNQAESLVGEGKYKQALPLLDESARLMFEAIRQARPNQFSENKSAREFEARKESVHSLRKAFLRITEKSKNTVNTSKIIQQLDVLLNSSDKEFKTGDLINARNEIDKAYHLLKVSIESIRGGQTLVRSLNFKNKEEEYAYEIDRNNTHKMLIGLLINNKKSTKAKNTMLQKFIDQAGKLRLQAESQANDKNFERAIELLEKSTKQFVRAIRSAGIYIPG